jgi:hypothetical protein
MKNWRFERRRKEGHRVPVDTGPNSWFDWWHTHPDAFGRGNTGPRARRKALERLRGVYSELSRSLAQFKKQYQTWVLINPADSSADAVYIHTENPNASNFPNSFEGVDWSAPAPTWLQKVFPPSQYRIGLSVENSDNWYWVKRHDT